MHYLMKRSRQQISRYDYLKYYFWTLAVLFEFAQSWSSSVQEFSYQKMLELLSKESFSWTECNRFYIDIIIGVF